MEFETYIRAGLKAQGLPVKEEDIESINDMLATINEEQESIKEFSDLKDKLPIKSFDKGVVDND